MTNLRNAMLVAVVAATALAAITGYLALDGSPGRLFLDGGLAVALAVVVYFMLSPTLGRIDSLVEALRALARGDRHQRVEPDQFAGLADIARALNEVAASMTEGDDPNLGPIKSVPRPGRPMRKELPPDAVDTSHHPEIGAVRVIKKTEPRASGNGGANVKTAPPTSVATDVPSPAGNAVRAGGAKGNDTAIDEAPRSDIPVSNVPSETEIAQVPSRAELEALFAEFVAAKKSHDETVADLDLEAFASTIQGECERLVTAHRCRGVRFEVTVQDGEVSLRPRLLR